MINRVRFPKIFFGWWTVVAAGLLFFLGVSYYMVGFSAMLKGICSELGVSRAATSVADSIGSFEGGFGAPVTGWLTDRFGPKWVVLAGTFLIGLGLILMNFINSLWALYLVWGGIVAVGCNIALTLAMEKAITNWFVKKRGVALSIRGMFAGLVNVAGLPLIIWLIATQGWRMTCVVGGVVMWLVGLPLVWFCVRGQRPEYYGLLPDGAKVEGEAADTNRMIERGVKYAAEVEEVEFTLRQAMRTRGYWLLILAYAGHTLVTRAVLIHEVPFLTDMGINPMRAAGILAIAGAVSIPMRFVGGYLADRVRREHLRFIVTGVFLLQAAGFIAFLLNQTIAMVYVLFIFFWIGFGIDLPLNAAVKARYFGRKGFGSIQGTSMMFVAPFQMIAPIYAGWIYDTTGSYITAFIVFAGLLAFSVVVMSFARPPKPPPQVTDIRRFL